MPFSAVLIAMSVKPCLVTVFDQFCEHFDPKSLTYISRSVVKCNINIHGVLVLISKIFKIIAFLSRISRTDWICVLPAP